MIPDWQERINDAFRKAWAAGLTPQYVLLPRGPCRSLPRILDAFAVLTERKKRTSYWVQVMLCDNDDTLAQVICISIDDVRQCVPIDTCGVQEPQRTL